MKFTDKPATVTRRADLVFCSNFPPYKENYMGPFAATFAGGLALALSGILALFASHFGFLFSGLDMLLAIITATGFCAISIVTTTVVLRRKAKRLASKTLFAGVVILTSCAVSLMSWFQTRDKLRLFINPIPSELHVHQGRSLLFGCYVHFSAPPSVVAAIISSKQLVIPATDIDKFAQERMNVSWSWWQPSAMSNPSFFMRNHTSDAAQGWTEGLWVNGSTNEVYAFIIN